MRNNWFRFRNGREMSTAVLAQDQAYEMVRQLALPLIPQRRVKGALEQISRDTGLTYSKTRKIFYRLTDNILYFEFKNIADAFKRAAIKQERLHRAEAERLAALIATNDELEGQLDLLNHQIFSGAMGAHQTEAATVQATEKA